MQNEIDSESRTNGWGVSDFRKLTAESFAAAAPGVMHDDFTTYGDFAFENNHVMPELIRIEQVQGGRWVSLTDPI